jgi:glycerol-3-phosphate dehydrogenase
VVNAAGPSVLSLIDRASLRTAKKMRLVRGSHIVVPRLFEHEYSYTFQLPDGRVLFAIPYERDFTLIGTTDRDHDPATEPIKASDEEIQYLCDGANQYFRKEIGPRDVVWTYSGVRPLIDDGSGKPEAATRGYAFELDGGKEVPPILSVFGGKITSYRHLASDALDKLSGLIPAVDAGGWTDKSPLPGGGFPITGQSELAEKYAREYPFLRPQWIDRLVKSYGTLARSWLKDAASLEDLGQHFGSSLTGAEVDYLIEREWARSAEDVLWRRTKLGLRLDAAEASELEEHISRKLACRDDGNDDRTTPPCSG